MARKLAAVHGLGDDDLIVSRTQLEELQSRVYCLQAALEDVERDLAQSSRAARRAGRPGVAARERGAGGRAVDRAPDGDLTPPRPGVS